MNAIQWTTLSLVLVSCASNPSARSVDPVPEIAFTSQGNCLEISTPDGPVPMKDFIKLAQRITGKVLTYSIADVEDSPGVYFVGTVGVSRTEFFDFFQTTLYTHGFRAIVRGVGSAQSVEIAKAR